MEAQVTIGSEKLVWEFGTLVVGKNSLVVFEDLRVANIDCIGMP